MKKLLTLFLLATLLLTACANPNPPIDETTTNAPSSNETTLAPPDDDTTTTEDTSSDVPDRISEYLRYENDHQYLILPISKKKVFISESYQNNLESIDIEMLKHAEKTIFDIVPDSMENPYCFLTRSQSGYLCLATEWISDINPPNVVTSENGTVIDKGCNIDHTHEYYEVRIEKTD